MTTPTCKLCAFLATMPRDEALEVNNYILERQLTADRAATLFSAHFGAVGATTVKKHRKESHREF